MLLLFEFKSSLSGIIFYYASLATVFVNNITCKKFKIEIPSIKLRLNIVLIKFIGIVMMTWHCIYSDGVSNVLLSLKLSGFGNTFSTLN